MAGEPHALNIAFFGSSLVSAYANGTVTYYRGIIRALADLGHTVTFYEPESLDRLEHRDMDEPPWAKVVLYDGDSESDAREALSVASDADVLIKSSRVGVFDDLLNEEILNCKRDENLIVFWDVDAPATLEEAMKGAADGLRSLIPRYDMILSSSGGESIARIYEALAAKRFEPIYNGLDPKVHHRVEPMREFAGDLAFLGNRLPDRERRVEEFFLRPAELMPDRSFLLGGSGWDDKPLPPNMRYLGHVYTSEHNALNSTPLAVLNISRHGRAQYGFTPAKRIFEAAGAGACIITDDWPGIEEFFTPGSEVLVASEGREVANLLGSLTAEKAAAIGAAARKRALAEHTYEIRAAQVNEVFASAMTPGALV